MNSPSPSALWYVVLACKLLLTCLCAFDCFSPSTSLCPLLAVGLSFSLVFSLQGAFSKALRTNCSNGNTNTVCAAVSHPLHPSLGPPPLPQLGLASSSHLSYHPSIHHVWCDNSCRSTLRVSEMQVEQCDEERDRKILQQQPQRSIKMIWVKIYEWKKYNIL